MAGFAKAKAIGDLAEAPVPEQLQWLAGLLEAEGTFLAPPPSNPRSPVMRCMMTDRDVIERVAKLFGTGVAVHSKGEHRTAYAATLKGVGAVALMRDLKPIMGSRRRAAIERAISAHVPPRYKLCFTDAEEIRKRAAEGEPVARLARSYRVAPQTIRPILQRHIYRSPPARPWRAAGIGLPEATPPPGVSLAEFYWLAGWLEGEGSFLAPPPSDPRRPRISAQARDQDVVVKVGATNSRQTHS